MAIAVVAPAEQRALLEVVDRFVRRTLAPRTSRHEAPMDAATLAAVLADADELGLAGADAAPTGLAPWEELDEGGAHTATLEVLRALARQNVATAFAVHQRALARVVARAAEVTGLPAGPLAVAPQGGFGLGRTAFARWLAGAPLDAADRAMLADVYAPGAARVLPVEPDVAALLAPVVEPDGALAWRAWPRAALRRVALPHAHGLDELVTVEVVAHGPPAARAPVEPARERASIVAAFAAHQLALVAIAAGAVDRALTAARGFAATRRQGGGPIDRHPAVLGLLHEASAALAQVDAQLARLGAARADRDPAALPAILSMRATAHPALAAAANAALQVFGGIGYMRDTGLEKIVRDVNHLRALAGAPRELALVAAEWERVHA
jgi:alkylation response protein AidB-like acyl-CoA dehydrogenase